MKKFILGYATPEAEELTEYTSKEQANYESEEWCEVEAETIEDARVKYEESFLRWQKFGHQL